MEKFAKIFVERPVTTFIVVLVAIVLGVNAFLKLELAMMPDVEYPSMMIMLPGYGMTSKEIEEKVIVPIERVLATVENVEKIESRAYNNYGMVLINFKWGTSLGETSLEVSEKLDMAAFKLPGNVKPMVFKFSPEIMPVVIVAISGDDWEKMYEAGEDLILALDKLSEVSYVLDVGMRKKEVQVRVDYRKLIRNGVGMSMVPTAIMSSGALLSGGLIFKEKRYYPVNVNSKLKDLNDLGNVLLPKGAGLGSMFSQMFSGVNLSTFMGPKPTLRLKDVARVEIGLREIRAGAKLNGRPSAFLIVQKRSGVNMITACRAIKKVIRNYLAPQGVKVDIVLDQSEYMEESLNTLGRNLLIGAAVVVLVLLVFLKDVRVVLLVATAIPVSLLIGLLFMYFSGMTINIMSLGGLALAVGMLIDNAIVVTESIYRRAELGDFGKKAAFVGAGEVGAAITASTLTTISVFLPIAFMKGFAERMFKDLALAVTYTLLASLLISLSFVPSMSQFLIGGAEPRLKGLKEGYKRLLEKILKVKWLIIASVLILFALSLLVIYNVGFSLMPTASPIQFRVRFFLPTGTSPNVAKEVASEIEQYLFEKKDELNLEYIYSSYGTEEDSIMNIFSMDSGYENGFVAVRFDRKKEIPRFDKVKTMIERELFSKLKKRYPGIYLDFLTPMTFETELFGRPLEIEIKGDDDEILKDLSIKILERIRSLKFLKNIKSTSMNMIRTYRIVPDQEKLMARKLSMLQIAAEVSALSGRMDAGSMMYKGRIMDISVYPENVGEIDVKDVVVPNMFGVRTRVSDVATVMEVEQPFMILHRDGRKVFVISADIEGISQSEALKKVKAKLRELKVPEGYSVNVRGQVEVTKREINQIAIAMLIGLVLMFMIMAGEFESFIHPLVIMFTVPMGLIGVALVYIFLNEPINVVAMIGIVMLFGIVVNNGIVMVDQINRLREKGMKKLEAVLEGASNRLRPILMTSLTTITALIPELILRGEGKEYHAPMAFTVVGGLSVATFLTLFFVPALYLALDKISRRFKD